MELEGWKMTFEEFNKRFERNMHNTASYPESYRAIEEVHESLTGKTKYSSYDSFRKVRERKMKK